ncbi:armadillo-type protein [Mariannaea sp. PMI_226]|nr:armadillo-type protein [Mariannaea sp. PMI_226]
MQSNPNTRERNEVFQKLSQLAIREEGSAASRQIIEVTDHILTILNDQIQLKPVPLDDKLAEYVFFPLYHVFKQMNSYPMLVIEKCVKCLNILVVHGWGSNISAKLVQQILTLLVFIIDGNPGSSDNRTVDEETVLESFRGLTALFNTAGQSVIATAAFAEADTIPVLGHAVSVILSGVVDGATPQIQQEALGTLQAVYLTIKEHAALATFLPGTISSLAKVLSTPAKYKQGVLSKSIDTVTLVLTQVLSDLRTRSIVARVEEGGDAGDDEKNKILSPTWLTATAGQVQKALSNIMKLRQQNSAMVRTSLRKLCVTLLDECHKSLENCAAYLVETAMILDEGGSKMSLTETNLQHLASIYLELGEMAKTTAYNWMASLPRIMQSGDEDAKQQAIHNLSKSLELLESLQIESSTLEDTISRTLTDSVVTLIQESKAAPVDSNVNVRLISGNDSTSTGLDMQFPPVLLPYESQKKIRSEMMNLVRHLGSSRQQINLAGNMLEQIQEANALGQVASFWLCFQLCKAGRTASTAEDLFLDLSSLPDTGDDLDATFNELYSTSVQILDRYSDVESMDWRLEALALEVTAYAAEKSGESFRPELIDVLFPVSTLLGSKNQNLQKHAIITLNSLAASCGYPDVSELIIDNVDYMLNSVSLRLNTLDISPASINVLTMMIRLAGPRLVPYLDDVIDSVFAALENYHGHIAFVEALFTVLKEVVDQGVRSDMLLLEYQKTTSIDHRKQPAQANGISSLLEILEKRKQREARDELDAEGPSGHPTEPWKSDVKEVEDDSAVSAPEPEKPPNSPTYQLLLRVANLTQHYLTSPTPTLRRSLLEMLTTVTSSLAPDEDAFLPLVNAIWPVVVDRLHDSEAFVAIEGCKTLSALCVAAGDFLGSRFKTEWHDWLRDWCRRAKRQSRASGRSRPHGDQVKITGLREEKVQILMPFRNRNEDSPPTKMGSYTGGLGQFASPARIWGATVELLTSMVSHVQVDEEMFDEILDLLADELEQNKQVREALEVINVDAVWLLRYERGAVQLLPTPEIEGVEFTAM